MHGHPGTSNSKRERCGDPKKEAVPMQLPNSSPVLMLELWTVLDADAITIARKLQHPCNAGHLESILDIAQLSITEY